MFYSILDILQVTGSLALFIYGMKVMSEAIQKAAGAQLRIGLRRITKSNFKGILIGSVATGIIQSSSATTVMIVSFVNAGLITVSQSAGLIMGANIGTTVTAWIVSLGGFLFKMKTVILPLLTLAIPVYMRNASRYRSWAEFVIGFCLLFLGLDFLKSSLPELQNEQVFAFIKDFSQYGFGSLLLFVVFGVIITILVQSSSVAMTLTLTMAFNGWLSPELAAAMILGENIGTTVTAEIAALVANAYARQSARFHSLFNILGACWMVFLIPIFMKSLESIFSYCSGNVAPFSNPMLLTLGLAAFHTCFNLVNTLIALPFLPILITLAKKTRPARSKKDIRKGLRFLPSNINISEFNSFEIQYEVNKLVSCVREMALKSQEFLNDNHSDKVDVHFSELRKLNKKARHIEQAIKKYSFDVGRERLSHQASQNINTQLSLSNLLLQMADLLKSCTYEIRDFKKSKVWFTPDQRHLLNELMDHLNMAIEIMIKVLNSPNENYNLQLKALETENKINNIRDQMRQQIIENSKEFDFNITGSLIVMKLITQLENVGDKVLQVNQTLMKTDSDVTDNIKNSQL